MEQLTRMQINLKHRSILSDGTVLHQTEAGITALYQGLNIDHMLFCPETDVHLYNQSNRVLDSQYPSLQQCTGVVKRTDWTQNWFTPEPWASMDLTQWVMSQCQNDTELELALEESLISQLEGMEYTRVRRLTCHCF